MKFYADMSNIPAQCGGRIIYNFTPYKGNNRKSLQFYKKPYGGFMLVATFNQHQKDAYEECCKVFTWLGQSTPIKNPETNNYIFTAVFKA